MEPPAFLWFHWKFQFMEYLFFLLVPDKPADKQHVSRGRFLLDFFGGLGYYMKWKISACPFRRSGGIALIWHSSTAAQVAAELQTDSAGGLTADQAEERLKQYGKNQLTEKKPRSLFLQFLDQMKDFMVVILIIAAVVSGITTWLQGENNWLEPIVIIAIVLLNALIGVVQENRAQKALSALKNMAAPHAKVLRSGVVLTIPAAELVPGDVILLDAGDYIPADGRLIEAASLHCEESALTGESAPSAKSTEGEIDDIAPLGDRFNMVYAGCSVSYGRGKAIVTETGMNTEIGRIATILKVTEDAQTPLQLKLASLGKTLGIVALMVCAVLFFVGVFLGDRSLPMVERIGSMFMTSIALAVAVVPESLPAVVTIVLALGVQRMVRKNAIIQRLPAVEALGSASVICSDKTGTLTQNRMTLVKTYTHSGFADLGNRIYTAGTNDSQEKLTFEVETLLRLAAICCDGRVEQKDGKEVHIGDPTETALVAASMKYLMLDRRSLDNVYPRMKELPFDSDRKLMTTVNLVDGVPYAVTKGAPDILLSRCARYDEKKVREANEQMAGEALRVLGVAIKRLESVPVNPTSEALERDLEFVGLVGMIDPPRPQAADSVRQCNESGIRTIMITGDHVATAAAIAKRLGILQPGQKAITGVELSQLSDEEFFAHIDEYSVYARVSPEDKIRIVQGWQNRGEVVAMTGDGVNDAPALKAADIGCAMGITGTDVAKGAADMTLTDDNFSTIVTAVKEGRSIYDNIRKTVHYLLSCNLSEVLAVFFGTLLFSVSPLLPIQLLWINLVTDGLPALALGMEPPEFDIMRKKPMQKNESIFSRGLGINVIWQGLLLGVLALIAFVVGRSSHPEQSVLYGQTMAFAVLAVSQCFHAFNARSSHAFYRAAPLKNLFLWLAFLGSLLLVALVMFTPLRTVFGLMALRTGDIGVVLALSVVPVVICEAVKLAKELLKK